MNKINRIKELISILNKYRDSYYNNQTSIVSDYEYDQLFDELKSLEESTGVVLSNSPTITVGYEVKSNLEKVKHSHPMLSLDKTKSTDELKKFADDKDCILSLKMDGLTVLLTYEDGQLVQAETRGNGEEGEIITHNAKVFENIPLRIDYKGHLEVEGEAIIIYEDFENINAASKTEYKNPRNLVSGSVRQLDSNIAAKRHIKFIAWKVPTAIDNFENNDSFIHRLLYIKGLGFEAVPLLTYAVESDGDYINEMIEALKMNAESLGYPIDGLVMTYNNIPYGESLGMTGHHPKHSIAFKFYDEEVETILRDIEWNTSKGGSINPVAVFDEVDLGGALTTRATLHNISYIEDLKLGVGDTITVYRANDVIPKVGENFTRSNTYSVPTNCPVCGGDTEIKQDNDSKVLICTNPNCKGKLLGKLTHFVSKNAMDIQGLSEATLEKLIGLGWLNDFIDIYNLKEHKSEMIKLEGFGKKSIDKLLNAIEKSRNTTLDRFIYSLSIPLIGKSASKDIAKACANGDIQQFIDIMSLEGNDAFIGLDGFGNEMSKSLNAWWYNNRKMLYELSNELKFIVSEVKYGNTILSGKTFVITGSLNHFANRDEAKEKIENLGGKVVGSVSAKTSYLVNNDINSTSGKNKKAKELGVQIITEEELLNLMK